MPSDEPKEWAEIENAQVITSTEGAGLFRVNGDEHWIPWSLIDENSIDRDGETGVLIVEEWKAIELGII